MNQNEQSLRTFGQYIQKVINGEDLTRRESYEMFRHVLLNAQPDLQQGAFLAALTAKGETVDEIAGAWQAIVELDTNKMADDLEPPLVENSGAGMDSLKTFNVSTAAAVIASAAGVRLARHGARALTSSCGTVDLAEAVGVNVDCGVEDVSRSIREAGIGLFNGMSPQVHPRALFRILSRIRFGSTLNIAASLASPCRPTHALRGVYSSDMIGKASDVMAAIGCRRAMVVHGAEDGTNRGMDEISNIGETEVRERFDDGTEQTYCLAPEDAGLKRRTYGEIAALGDVRQEAVRFMKVIAGADHPACMDIACLNAGAVMYLAGKAPDIRDGVSMSRDMISSGEALKKLTRWVTCQADAGGEGVRRLVDVASAAGLRHEVRAML